MQIGLSPLASTIMTSLSRSSTLSSLLLKTIGCNCVRWNSNRASIGRINRTIYSRMYPVTIVRPDGSSFRIRFKEPRRIITLPIDIELLSPEEKQQHLQKRKPKQVVKVVEDFEDDFDIERYSHLWKKFEYKMNKMDIGEMATYAQILDSARYCYIEHFVGKGKEQEKIKISTCIFRQ